VEQLHWRLKNGELPPIVPPKVIVIACGTNSKGMVRPNILRTQFTPLSPRAQVLDEHDCAARHAHRT